MTKKEDKIQRRALVRSLAQKKKAKAEAELPISKPDLEALFDWVDEKLRDEGCDHTLSRTISFIEERGLPVQPVVEWLQRYGGHCDCEVIANVEDEWTNNLA